MGHMTIPEPITATSGGECSDWAAMIHFAIPKVQDGATRFEVGLGAISQWKLEILC